MATLKCPRCEFTFTAAEGWAKATVSTLILSPAVPDMATQVRCPQCGRVFAESEIRYLRATSSRPMFVFLISVVVGLAAWFGYQFLSR